MTEKQEQPSAVLPFPTHSIDANQGAAEQIALNPQSQRAIQEIQQRTGHTDSSAEDVVALAVEVFNQITSHLSQEDSRVILHKQGVGVKTLDIKSSAGSFKEGVRTVYKQLQPPKKKLGGDRTSWSVSGKSESNRADRQT